MKWIHVKSKEVFVEIGIIIIASIISISSFIYYFKRGYILIYADAFAHLDIAREVFDSLTPGIVQLGTVWLPLQHILMLPFIWNNYLWHTGIAGSIGSMMAYVLAVYFTYKTGKLLTNNIFSGIIAASVLGLNANYIYMQVTPMSESIMIASISAFLYFLLKWSQTQEISDLIVASVCVCLSSLTRYEGWFLTIFGALFVFLVTLRKKSYNIAESRVLLFSAIAFSGIILWIIYNFIIVGDGLSFLHGPFSAKSQQDQLYLAGSLPTKHNIIVTTETYIWNILDVEGIFIIIASLISLILFFSKKPNSNTLLYIVSAFGPPAVIILTLYLGITVIAVPQVAINHTYGNMFNIRYGLMSLPFVALCISLFGSFRHKKIIATLVFILIIAQAVIFYKNNYVLTLNDSLKGTSGFHISTSSQELAAKLHKDCSNYLTLMFIGSHDETLIASNIDVKHYIYEGNYIYWQTALKDPTKYYNLKCIVMGTTNNPLDEVRTALFNNIKFKKNYNLVYKNDSDLIYEKNNL